MQPELRERIVTHQRLGRIISPDKVPRIVSDFASTSRALRLSASALAARPGLRCENSLPNLRELRRLRSRRGLNRCVSALRHRRKLDLREARRRNILTTCDNPVAETDARLSALGLAHLECLSRLVGDVQGLALTFGRKKYVVSAANDTAKAPVELDSRASTNQSRTAKVLEPALGTLDRIKNAMGAVGERNRRGLGPCDNAGPINHAVPEKHAGEARCRGDSDYSLTAHLPDPHYARTYRGVSGLQESCHPSHPREESCLSVDGEPQCI